MELISAKKIVERHDGTIQVENEEEKSTTLTMRLPINPKPEIGK